MNIERKRSAFAPDYAIAPGATVLEMLEQFGLSQAEFAERAGRPKKTINEIIKGKAAITPETALQFESVLGAPAAFWNALEQNFRASLARREERERLETQVAWIERFPVRELQERKLIAEGKDRVDLLRGLLQFFGVASTEAWIDVWRSPQQTVSFRRAAQEPTDMGMVAAWLRQGEIAGRAMECAAFDELRFKDALKRVRGLTAADFQQAFDDAQKLCAAAGVALVLVPEFPRLRICGATRWLQPQRALIQLSLFYKRDDQFWFSFFHEAAHLLLHGKKELFVEQQDHSEEREEQEANNFAANFLIPVAQYSSFVADADFSKSAIRAFAATIGISASLVLGRLQHDQHVGYHQHNDLHARPRQ